MVADGGALREFNLSRSAGFACVVGAPRCGTTSLSGFLKEHPDVCFSLVKEPHYFAQNDLSGLAADRFGEVVREQYLARYFTHRCDDQLLAEGSVSYLYAAERMEAIVRSWPDARFIIAVRDPLEMLPSLHRRLLYTGDETVGDFDRAWDLMEARSQGRRVPRTCIDPRMLQYAEIGRLGSYVERFFAAVGRERCQVVVFDDLAADPADVYRRMIGFLGLTPHVRRDYAPRRRSAGFKNGWLQRLLKRPPIATRAVLAGEMFRRRVAPIDRQERPSALLRAVFGGRKRLLSWNRQLTPTPRPSAAMQRKIHEALAGEVELLSELIGRDLSHWLGGTRRKAVRPARAVLGLASYVLAFAMVAA